MTFRPIPLPTKAQIDERSAYHVRQLLLETLLRRRTQCARKGSTVSVTFDTELEAQEFHKVLMRVRRNG